MSHTHHTQNAGELNINVFYYAALIQKQDYSNLHSYWTDYCRVAYINNVVRADVNVVDVNNVSLTLGTTGSHYFQHNMLSLLARVYLPTISVTTDMAAAPIQV